MTNTTMHPGGDQEAAAMAKAKQQRNNPLPHLTGAAEPEVKSPEPKPEVEPKRVTVDTQKDNQTASEVVWVTLKVPLYMGSSAESGHLPDRVDTGHGILHRQDRVAIKRLARGLDLTAGQLRDGKSCKENRSSAMRWLIQQISEAVPK